MKKVLLFLLLIASVSVAWAQSITIDGITYTISGDHASAKAESTSITSAPILSKVTIDNDEYDVTEIAEEGFMECTNLTSVVIPEGVTTIGDYAFDNCSNLTSVTLPNSLVNAGDGTFRGCNLTSLVLPENVEEWGSDLITLNPNFEVVYIVNPNKTLPLSGDKYVDFFDMINSLYGTKMVLNESYLGDELKEKLDAYLEQQAETGNVHFDYFSVDFDYTLTVSDAGAATLYLPFAVTIPEDADYFVAATVSSISISGTTGYAHMKMIKKGIIPAFTGVIIQANPGDYTLSMTTDEVTESIGTNKLEGVFEETEMSTIEAEGYDVYVLRRGVTENLGFKKVGTGSSLTTLSPFKAYLPMAQNAGVKSVNLTFGGDLTGIEALEQAGLQKKSTFYNLQGQRVENPTRGIYIINGKKTLFQ